MGSVSNGSLVNGQSLLKSGKGFISNPNRTNKEAYYGTVELVKGIINSAKKVAKNLPGADLIVNDLSFKNGGQIPHHGSHQSGRDADLLFYMNDKQGNPVKSISVHFDEKGEAKLPESNEPVYFDVKRNWLLIKYLVMDKNLHLQRLFISEALRKIILDEAQKDHKVPQWVKEHAADMMCEPNTPHDDHLHIRVYCTIEDIRAGCKEIWPIFPWRREEIKQAGIVDIPMSLPPKRVVNKLKQQKRPFRRRWCP